MLALQLCARTLDLAADLCALWQIQPQQREDCPLCLQEPAVALNSRRPRNRTALLLLRPFRTSLDPFVDSISQRMLRRLAMPALASLAVLLMAVSS